MRSEQSVEDAHGGAWRENAVECDVFCRVQVSIYEYRINTGSDCVGCAWGAVALFIHQIHSTTP